jgi:DNA (cytosine-5)-methyltransferase 1
VVHLIATDLFSGGGGLTCGLKAVGFTVESAVEIDRTAYLSYVANHPSTRALNRDVRIVTGAELMPRRSKRRLDLVAGCPPCQGFTSLTAKWKRDDPRNRLVREMSRIVRETMPTAVMMENVPRLAQSGEGLFSEFIADLEGLGYRVTWDLLQVADYGTPQNRRRLVLLAGLGFVIPLPKPTHSRSGKRGLAGWRTVRDVLKDLQEPSIFVEVKDGLGSTVADWHVVRRLSGANRERLRFAKPGRMWWEIPEEYRPPCHQGGYVGFRNAYGRMEWDNVAPTITAGCTSFSKGRFGHPEQERTISVREAALLQEFQDTYFIRTRSIDAACQIIGNALPCGFAAAVAREVFDALQAKAADLGRQVARRKSTVRHP